MADLDYLEVEFLVADGDESLFEAKVESYLKSATDNLFAQYGWVLQAALKNKEFVFPNIKTDEQSALTNAYLLTKDGSRQLHGPHEHLGPIDRHAGHPTLRAASVQRGAAKKPIRWSHYCHLWSYPGGNHDCVALYELMQQIMEIPLYNDIDALVCLETQNVFRWISAGSDDGSAGTGRTELPDGGGHGPVFRTTFRVAPGEVVDFRDVYLDMAFDLVFTSNWQNVGLFYHVTGALNTLTGFWEPPEDTTRAEVQLVMSQSLKPYFDPVLDPKVIVIVDEFETAAYWGAHP